MSDITNLRIAFVISPSNYYSTTSSGVVRQSLAWAKGLSSLGHRVDFPVVHETFDWQCCDLVHFFQYGSWAEGLITKLRKDGLPVVLSPIVDRPATYGWRCRAVAHIPFERLGLEQKQRLLYRTATACDAVLVRSDLEARSLRDLGIAREKVRIVRLGVNVTPDLLNVSAHKTRHVFHLSHLDHPRKNVRTLVLACRKLGVPLHLAGKISDASFGRWLEQECAANPALRYLGVLDEERKWEEMRGAAVFCLPSLTEGVGLVALEAYLAGAHVVITERSGGCEYFDGEAEICNPSSVEDVAKSLQRALVKPVRNEPRNEALAHLSVEASVGHLVGVYQTLSRSTGEC